jgi:hypothetical protein
VVRKEAPARLLGEVVRCFDLELPLGTAVVYSYRFSVGHEVEDFFFREQSLVELGAVSVSDGEPRSEIVYEVIYCFGEVDLHVVFEDVGLGKILLDAKISLLYVRYVLLNLFLDVLAHLRQTNAHLI